MNANGSQRLPRTKRPEPVWLPRIPRGCRVELGKERVSADLPEPVTGICGIGFVSVKDSVPIAAVLPRDVLRDPVRLIEGAEVEPETGECRLGSRRPGKKVRGRRPLPGD